MTWEKSGQRRLPITDLKLAQAIRVGLERRVEVSRAGYLALYTRASALTHRSAHKHR